MSCQILQKASISDLSKVKKILFPEDQEDDEIESWSGADAWSWKTDFETETKPNKPSDNWLQSCLISCSSQSEVILIAHLDRFVVLTSKWEKVENNIEIQKYHVVNPSSNNLFVGEKISAVLCLPITSYQKTSQGMPDWICLIIGYTSGMVRMYTMDGNLLITEAFHGEPVHQIQFHSSIKNQAQQELTILYEKVLIVVEGIGLFNSLKASRNCLAKGRATYGFGDAVLEHPPLHYKKFGLQEQKRINACFLVGTSAPTNFDHLVTASVVGGFQAKYNHAPPIATGILSLGSLPYCAWHYAIEGSVAPLLSDVAYALASRVTSKILSKTSGWLGWGGSDTTKVDNAPSRAKEKQMMEPATSIYPRFGLADSLREAWSVVVSPNQRLAAVTDSLGRVILLDLPRGIAVRMWKGYRDAQCGWITSWESDQQSTVIHGTNPRTVSFLVLYIPKRGIIEIWVPQQGAKVAAFNCVKGAKLLNLSTGFSTDKELAQCCLLGPDGRIDEIAVPFHCSLKGDSSQRARDLHLLQQFKSQLFREINERSLEVLLEIRHSSVVTQALDALLESEQLLEASAFLQCIECLISHYNESKALDAESRLVLARCELIANLTRVFMFIDIEHKAPPDYDTAMETSSAKLEDIVDALLLHQEEIHRVLNHHVNDSRKHLDKTPSDLKLHTFLRSFDVCVIHSESNIEGKVKLKNSLRADERGTLCHWLWGILFARSKNVAERLFAVLKTSRLVAEDLASLLIYYWLNHCPLTYDNLLNFHELMRRVCKLAAPENLFGANGPSPWWHVISGFLTNSNSLKPALCATLVCRSVISELEKERVNEVRNTKEQEGYVVRDDSLNEWENMSIDLVRWNVLSKQLEDLCYLAQLLHFVPTHLRQHQIFQLEYRPEEPFEQLDFTLGTVLQKGRGSVTELIARWIVGNLLDPSSLFTFSCVEPLESIADEALSISKSNNLSAEAVHELEVIREILHNVSKQLPHSTERDVVFVNTAVEYAALWRKIPNYFNLLECSFNSISSIRSNLLRHGICRTLWSMFFSSIFMDVAILMDKLGRLPKSFSGRKICLPSPEHVEPFLQLTMKLLDTAVTSAMSCEVEPPPLIRYDDIWPTCEGATPMIEVALRQRLVNIDLVLLHHQLAQALHLIASLEIKGIHCLSLFDQAVGRQAFFKEFHSYPPLPTKHTDPTVTFNRLQFLKQVIVKAVDLMEHHESLALDYINQAIKLAYEWDADLDELRIKYVELLFNYGKDHFANEVLPSIGSDPKLGQVLLATVGMRLHLLLKPSDIAVLSPLTTEWLARLRTSQASFKPAIEMSLEKNLYLVVEALRRLPSESCDQKIAGELHALLLSLQAK